MKKIAMVNDLSGFGKCSLSVALPIISTMGVQCCPLATGVFSNQTGYDSYKSVDLSDNMVDFVNEWIKLGASFEGIVTGFIPNSRQGEIISSFIDTFKTSGTTVIVDPIMGDNGELYPCYDEESIRAVKQLASKADIITPNLTELCCLANEDYHKISSLNQSDMTEAVGAMCEAMGKRVVTTGITLGDNDIATIVYDNGCTSIVKTQRIGGSFSGTGDILVAIVSAGIVNGMTLLQATEIAADFITKSIKETIKDTDGKYNPADGIHFEKYLHTLGQYNEK